MTPEELIEGAAAAPSTEESQKGQAPQAAEDTVPELPDTAEDTAGEAVTEIDFADTAAKDLAALLAEVPELAGITSLTELQNPIRYGELRELGLTPAEAYYATRGRGAGRKHATADRAHLAVSVGRTASLAGARLSPAEMAEARDLFPSLSDREIEALYRRVSDARRA